MAKDYSNGVFNSMLTSAYACTFFSVILVVLWYGGMTEVKKQYGWMMWFYIYPFICFPLRCEYLVMLTKLYRKGNGINAFYVNVSISADLHCFL